jgi:hypothetical protein
LRKLYLKSFSCIAGRWKFKADADGFGKLTNGKETVLPGKWKIPQEEKIDYISSDDGINVLGLSDIIKGEGYKVISMKKIDDSSRAARFVGNVHQKWKRSKDDGGYFALINQFEKDKLYLHAGEDGSMLVGMNVSIIATSAKPEVTTTASINGAVFKTIEISAIFIQLLLLAELLMM